MVASLPLLPVGASIVQTLLRGAEFICKPTAGNMASLVGDINKSWELLAKLSSQRDKRDALERDVSKRLETKVAQMRQAYKRRGLSEQLLAGAITEVENLVTDIGDNPKYFVDAVQNPEVFLRNLRKQMQRRKKNLEEAAEMPFDQLAEAAAEEIIRLAPSSPQFQLGALLRILTDLSEAVDEVGVINNKLDYVLDLNLLVNDIPFKQNGFLGHDDRIRVGIMPKKTKNNIIRHEYESVALGPMRIYALLGPSGIGKSQIASSWVRRSEATFIMWIDAKSTTSILQAYEEGYQIITATPENINNNTQIGRAHV